VKVSLGPRPLAVPAPVWLIGSYDGNGRPNAMAASWAGICCSEPPCVAVAVRPERYSHAGIAQRGAFTVSVPSAKHAVGTDVLGTASGRDGDKFAAAGLTAVASDLVDAPYVSECPVVLECRVRESLDLGSHTLFVGEILDVKADPAVLSPSGALDVEAIDPFVLLSGYRALGRVLPRNV
jgi:flavin reductase (DIM6/NTAB) family NADH-FMN oxidoreductase RutF